MRLNFLEIGTSDFESETDKAKDSDVDMAVEPLDFYLDSLPTRPRCTKINAAISDTSGWCALIVLRPS